MKKIIREFLRKRGYDIQKLYAPIIEINGKSDDEKYSFHPTPIGNYYLPKGIQNDIIAERMKCGHLFEPEVINFVLQKIKPNTIVLDIGSNFGQMAIEFSKHVGDNGKVYAFEAQKKVYEVLEKNIQANNPNKILSFYNAVYNQNNIEMVFPELDFSKYTTLGSFGLNPQISKGTSVKSITIDSLNIEQEISFMKVDIQGSDLAALQGAKETIMRHKMPILFEFEQHFQKLFNTNFQDYVDFVNSINYKFAETILDINFYIIPKD